MQVKSQDNTLILEQFGERITLLCNDTTYAQIKAMIWASCMATTYNNCGYDGAMLGNDYFNAADFIKF